MQILLDLGGNPLDLRISAIYVKYGGTPWQQCGMDCQSGAHVDSYFCRIFSRATGETFTDYVNHQKVAWGKEMLRDPSITVSQIAAELGYLDTSYFIRVFKKYEGVTPLVYRQHKHR